MNLKRMNLKRIIHRGIKLYSISDGLIKTMRVFLTGGTQRVILNNYNF